MHTVLLVLLVALVTLAAPPPAGADPCAGLAARHRFTADQTFTYTFANEEQRTRWAVTGCVDASPGRPNGHYGLVIGITTFFPYPDRPIQVFYDARVSEMFVVYHDGDSRFRDIGVHSQGLMTLTTTDCPAALGTRLADNRICREVRDRGLAWKTDTASRRGKELVLWGVLRVSNYKYVLEWTFRDDGTVLGRVGPTGHNQPMLHAVTHQHTTTWRLDVDLDGAAGDSVRVLSHSEHFREPDEAGQVARDTLRLVRTEQGIDWVARGFTMLKIQDAQLRNQNAVPKPSGFLVIPMRSGTGRHQEEFAHHDFWVTRAPANKTSANTQLEAFELPSYVNGQDVNGQDVVVWYTTTLHHIERDEDDLGPTQIVWIGFLMLPFDLFDRSPLGEVKPEGGP